MTIKLTPIGLPQKPKNKYNITVKCMHGDADAFTDEEYDCVDEADFIATMSAFNNMPQPTAEGGNEDAYDTWCADTFGEDCIPWDVTGYDCRSTVRKLSGFYYDENGTKFGAELI